MLRERQLRNEDRRHRRELQEERRRLKEERQRAREQVQRERDERNQLRQQRIAEKEKKWNDELVRLVADAKQAREAELERMHAKKAAADEELAKAAGAVAQARQKLQELRATKDALVLQLKQVTHVLSTCASYHFSPADITCALNKHDIWAEGEVQVCCCIKVLPLLAACRCRQISLAFSQTHSG